MNSNKFSLFGEITEGDFNCAMSCKKYYHKYYLL